MFDDNYVKIESTFAGGAYTRVPALIRVTDKTGAEASVSMAFAIFNQSAEYLFDASHVALIDISDFVQVCDIGIYYTIQLSIGEQTRIVHFKVDGALSADDVIVPNVPRIWYTKEGVGEAMIMTPPLRFQLPPDVVDVVYPELITELYVRNLFTEMKYNGGSLIVGRNNVSGNALVLTSVIENDASLKAIEVHRQQAVCGRRYAFVRWQSRFGGWKCHVWEVAECASSVGDVVSTMTPYGIPAQRKTYQEEYVLKLDNLTEYDYWYYADIITSDDVRVIMADNGETTFDDYTRVVVANKDYALPYPNKTSELNINVIYAKRQ